METEWGPGKEKAKGQLGNFLKRDENQVSVCPIHWAALSFRDQGLQALHGSQGGRAAGSLGGGPWLDHH